MEQKLICSVFLPLSIFDHVSSLNTTLYLIHISLLENKADKMYFLL